MSDAVKVTIELDDLMQLCNERRAYKAEAERGEKHLVSAENALQEKDDMITRLDYMLSATEDTANSEIDCLQRKNRKLKKKLKKAKAYAEEMEGAAMFGQNFEGIKCLMTNDGIWG